MIAGAWLCLLAPLAGALAITLAGTRISRSTAAWVSTGSVFVAFAGALVALVQVLGENPDDRSHLSTAYTYLAAGKFNVFGTVVGALFVSTLQTGLIIQGAQAWVGDVVVGGVLIVILFVAVQRRESG